jgi:hypothetical protein
MTLIYKKPINNKYPPQYSKINQIKLAKIIKISALLHINNHKNSLNLQHQLQKKLPSKLGCYKIKLHQKSKLTLKMMLFKKKNQK